VGKLNSGDAVDPGLLGVASSMLPRMAAITAIAFVESPGREMGGFTGKLELGVLMATLAEFS